MGWWWGWALSLSPRDYRDVPDRRGFTASRTPRSRASWRATATKGRPLAVVKKDWVTSATKDPRRSLPAFRLSVDALVVVLGRSDAVNFLQTRPEQAGVGQAVSRWSITVDQTVRIQGNQKRESLICCGTAYGGSMEDGIRHAGLEEVSADYKAAIPARLSQPVAVRDL